MAAPETRDPVVEVGTKEPTKPAYKYVGKSVTRIDSVAKVTGASRFSTDFYLKGMLHAKILFSDRPYARIIDIDISKALALPGVKAVITGDDAPIRRYGVYLKDKTILAKGEVRYIGDRVAAVAAVTERIAEQAVSLIKVRYEDLDPLLDTTAALKEGASRLHPDVAEYEAGFPYIRYGNVCMEAELARGDVATAFAESDVVLEAVYRTGAVNQAPIEPHACVAGFDHRGRLTVWTATQQLSVCHAELAAALEIPMVDVRVIPLECGGGFGGKLDTNLEPLTALLAQKAGRAVRLAMTREEEFVAANNRAPFEIKIKLGATSDGKLTGGEVDIVADAGAYADHVVGTASHALSSSEGVYRFPSWKVRTRAVYTNNPDYGCMRGYGTIQALFALETHLDALARKIAIDPAELRLANLVEDGDELISSAALHDVHIRETMETALDRSGYWEKKGSMGPNRGIGIANIVKTVGLLSSSATVRLNEDGTVAITTAAVEIGCGTHTVLSQIAAEVLDVPIDRVSVGAPESDSTAYDLGSIASRTVFDNGSAVRLATEDLRAKIVECAARELGCDADEVMITEGRVHDVSSLEGGMTLEAVAGTSIYGAEGPLVGFGVWSAYRHHDDPVGGGFAEGIYPTFGFGTHVAEVEIDPGTGQVSILDYTACHDVGKAINPMALEGQIEGGVAQGLGGALWEEMLVSDGRILNPNLVDYRLPTIMDVPRVQISLVEVPDALGPFGAKGIGEHPILGPGPSIANAIADASGVLVNQIPVTPERLLDAIDASTPG
ncbi:MAG: xanthine dehydrogenase family protein molybdopterin-binding subunit [Acidimicrobiia bacterium]|nr:MAG: xanthine dehydrogenase family protein molybdopterin-binding subunit [Acidimicrobiia bacterium]